MSGFHEANRRAVYTFIYITFVLFHLTACSLVIPNICHTLVPISEDDQNDLRSGNLLAIRDRYEQRKNTTLSVNELALLCDIYIKHMSIDNADKCLDSLQTRAKDYAVSSRITGKRALIAYLVGHYQRASNLSKDLKGNGGKYVYALAKVRLGDTQTALDIAERWRLAFDLQEVFLSANLYMALERYEDVLSVLNYPEPGLSRYYSLSGTRNVFDQQVKPAPLKIDLFDEFGFCILDTYSYAPAVNVYVEYLLAKAYLETGDLKNARSRFDTIINYQHIHAYREVQWRALHDRARIAEMDGDIQRAIELNRKAIGLIETIRASISTEAGRIGFVGNKQAVYSHIIRLFIALGDVADAFEFSERARSRALVDVLATQRKFGLPLEIKQDVGELIHDYQIAEYRILEIQGSADATSIQERTRSLLAKRQIVLSRAPLLSGLTIVDDATDKLEKIGEHLTSDETLLSYFKLADDWYVFVINRKGIVVHQLDLPNIAQEIADIRHMLSSGMHTDYVAQGQMLYDRLIRPIEGRLTETLTIVPYSELHYLPFAALHSGDAFLIEKHKLRILPSAEVATILRSTEKPKGSLLVLGNPSRNDASPLPYAEDEAQQIAQIYRPSELLIGKDATLYHFIQKAHKHDILHIAAHGEFNKDQPLQSRLLLTPSTGDTGDLTVSRLYSMEPKLNINIAVLSACETGLADIATGDELIGLQRGFLFAGADSIIGSLWRIPDQTTVYLMKHFYEGLNRQMSRAEALRYAQLETLKKYPNKATWAAFTYIGGI